MPDHLLKKKGKFHFTPFEVWVNTKQLHAISKLAILVPEDNLILMELVSATHFSFSLSTLSLSLSLLFNLSSLIRRPFTYSTVGSCICLAKLGLPHHSPPSLTP